MSERDEPEVTISEHLLGGGETSLLEAVDGLLNRGVLLEGDLVLGLADVDLVYLRLSTLLAAADRIFGGGSKPPPEGPETAAPPPAGPSPAPPAGAEPRAAAPPPPAAEADRPTPAAQPGSGADTGAGEESVDALRDRLERTFGTGGTEQAPGASEESPGEPGAPAVEEPARLRQEEGARTPRWNAAPEDVERSVARLVLALVDFLRQLMERQAIRRMEEGTLTETEVERLGQALMRLEQTVHDMARRFGLDPEDLNLDLGPLGRLT